MHTSSRRGSPKGEATLLRKESGFPVHVRVIDERVRDHAVGREMPLRGVGRMQGNEVLLNVYPSWGNLLIPIFGTRYGEHHPR
ncbi:MAG TPA: hypothetical protein VF846_07315 [Thermoanaerobaculia bacterium]